MQTRVIAMTTTILVSVLAGCGSDDCQVVCEKNAECRPDSPEQACIDLCEELSQDEAYADALEEQAGCIEDEECEAIAAGACAPDYS
jgi:hypothetical protein